MPCGAPTGRSCREGAAFRIWICGSAKATMHTRRRTRRSTRRRSLREVTGAMQEDRRSSMSLEGHEFVYGLVLRLEGLRFFPQSAEARAELVRTLMLAPTKDAAESFVTNWLRTQVFAQTPSDIYRMFGADPDEERLYTGYREPACSKCGDTGYEVVIRGGLSGARECVCRRKLRATEDPKQQEEENAEKHPLPRLRIPGDVNT